MGRRSCYVADESAIDPSEDATEVRRLPRDTDSGVVVRDREWRAVRTFQVARTGTYTVWCESD
ncbi:hypothetical protein I6H58_07055 [Rothia kristinae]|uniref:Uncharacterized protein n=1 Tax=Rothia kristinae TaxID=37923 RepID=A0A7T4MSE4_9MICC|nr:hypothetical protein [Rothia kristinae]QQC58738.1 hypothetical protein I6H58_07055 [Rothia kristinae]